MDTPASSVAVSVEASVATLVLHNPASKNALTRPMRDRMVEVFAELAGRADVKAVVVTGAAGDFCAGMDLSEFRPGTETAATGDFVRVEEALAHCPVPTIAAIDGYCVGGGVQLAIACDIRVAAPGARFAVTPAKLGIVYPAASVARLVRTVGPAVAKRLLFTADLIDARTALRHGIVTDLADEGGVLASAESVARTVASRSSVSTAAAKEMIGFAAATGEVPAEVADRWQEAENGDLPVGLEAFAARRAPVFPDRAVGGR
ncbi:enoyl-CoA hydratase/isomerase family protein [Saccharopolyspora taberi]|uniref:Enoyl-CoA hydratase/isomerase family protein n=1 Tax=Saccharopolyspora taberi TaxID=60895 RepID=A0ABN3VAR5_9PSEU